MEKKPSILEQKLDKDFNIPALYMLKTEFTKDGRLTAKGRLYFKLALIIPAVIYFGINKDLVMTLAAYFTASLIISPVYTITSKTLVKALKLKEYNLYDALAAFGSYCITYIIAAAVYIIVYIKLWMERHPESFNQILADGTPTAGGILIGIGAIFFIIDLLGVLLKKA